MRSQGSSAFTGFKQSQRRMALAFVSPKFVTFRLQRSSEVTLLSINVVKWEPRLRASKPSAPVPQKPSSTRDPRIPDGAL